MRNRTLTILLLIYCFLACSQSHRSLSEQLQSVLDKAVRKYTTPGVSVAAILPDGTLWRGVSGKSHDTLAIEPAMLFAIGSITKNFVAALVLQLVEEGKLSLDDSLYRWVPRYSKVDSTITIRQLLNHTSGLFMFWEHHAIWDDLKKNRTRIFTPEEVLGYLQDPYFAPGKGHRYSNTNYLLMAMVVTNVTGSTLSAELRKRFWEPLGLNSACFYLEEKLPDNVAHVWGDNFNGDGSFRDITLLPRLSHESITYGSAGIFMTAEDLSRWADALFQGKVLKPASLAEMLKFNGDGYHGLGIARFSRGFSSGERAYGHSGGNIGTTAYMVHLPDFRISISVMINSFDGKCASAITEDLIEVLTEVFASKKNPVKEDKS